MNVIVNAFAFKEDYGQSNQIGNKTDAEKMATYMKNIVVSLVSAKRNNPEDEVMLVTNREIENPYSNILTSNNIKINVVPFEKYVMPKRFMWALAFYKLNVLEYLATETDYEKILMIDNDTYCSRAFDDIWKEADHGIIMCPVNHTYSHPERDKIRQDYYNLYPDEKNNLVHYGGEFWCGTRERLVAFMELCKEVYDRIVESDYKVIDNIGDETISSIAAIHYKQREPIFECGAYLFRYWTEKRFYLAATNWSANPVCIWHVPSEKDRGMILLYNYIVKKGDLPTVDRAAKTLALPQAKRPLNILTLKGRLNRYRSNKR